MLLSSYNRNNGNQYELLSAVLGGASRRLVGRKRFMAIGQALGMPREFTAFEMELPTELARIVAVAHSWRA
jgi:hypothetical protein